MAVASVLGACGGDEEVAQVIKRDEVVHEYSTDLMARIQLAVSGLDGSGPRPLTNLAGGARVPAVSPDGRLVVFQSGERLWLYEVGTAEARQFTFGPPLDASARWSRDGQRIVYASMRFAFPSPSDICIRDITGRRSHMPHRA